MTTSTIFNHQNQLINARRDLSVQGFTQKREEHLQTFFAVNVSALEGSFLAVLNPINVVADTSLNFLHSLTNDKNTWNISNEPNLKGGSLEKKTSASFFHHTLSRDSAWCDTIFKKNYLNMSSYFGWSPVITHFFF